MTLQEILSWLYSGSEWNFHNTDGTGDLYADLDWLDLQDEKPSEATIRSREAEAEAIKASTELATAQERIFRQDAPDQLLRYFEVLNDFVAEIYRVLPTASKNAFDATILQQGQTAKQRIEQIRAIAQP